MRQRFLVVHNPIAGWRDGQLLHDVARGLQLLGASVTLYDGDPTSLPTRLRDTEGQLDAVVAAGGDGTIRALAALIDAHNLPLGVIPMGTGNVLAHEIGLPRTAVGLADLLLNGPVREFEGGRANGEPFFLMAGVGFDGEVIRHLDTPLKRRVGKLAYARPIVRALSASQPELNVEIDGRQQSARWVIVANARCYGGAFVVAPDAGLDRAGLVAVTLNNASQIGLVRQLIALGTGRLQQARGVTMTACRSVTVQCAEPVAAQLDGDPFGSTPISITAGGAKMRLIVPQTYAGEARAPAVLKAS